ncbi:MAG: hypothetical protein JWO38_5370 [Gemmataceae bacterium]|nr:hypothetical protein [Gemmataceae bacterium]
MTGDTALRIAIASYYVRPVGGVETYVRSVITEILARGHELTAVTIQSGDPVAGGAVPAGVPWVSGAGLTGVALAATVAALRPDVVYTHGLGEPELEAGLAARLPTVYFAHNYAGGCISGTKSHALPSARACTRPLGPGCLGLYLPRRCGGLNPLEMVRLYRRERSRQELFRTARFVAVASRHMAAEAARNGAPEDRVKLTPLFPPAMKPDPDPPPPKPPTGRVLFVGRITAPKGWRHLLDAVPQASAALGRPLTLVVAGDGPDRDAFEAETRRRGVPAEFLGWVGAAEREAEMRRADVLAVPSVWPEPFGLVGIEAGCVGLPAAGFAVGGIPDWLTPGVSGESAPGERPDPRELADALVRVLADAAHFNRLRVGAWESARRFTPAAHLDRLLPVLEAAVKA